MTVPEILERVCAGEVVLLSRRGMIIFARQCEQHLLACRLLITATKKGFEVRQLG